MKINYYLIMFFFLVMLNLNCQQEEVEIRYSKENKEIENNDIQDEKKSKIKIEKEEKSDQTNKVHFYLEKSNEQINYSFAFDDSKQQYKITKPLIITSIWDILWFKIESSFAIWKNKNLESFILIENFLSKEFKTIVCQIKKQNETLEINCPSLITDLYKLRQKNIKLHLYVNEIITSHNLYHFSWEVELDFLDSNSVEIFWFNENDKKLKSTISLEDFDNKFNEVNLGPFIPNEIFISIDNIFGLDFAKYLFFLDIYIDDFDGQKNNKGQRKYFTNDKLPLKEVFLKNDKIIFKIEAYKDIFTNIKEPQTIINVLHFKLKSEKDNKQYKLKNLNEIKRTEGFFSFKINFSSFDKKVYLSWKDIDDFYNKESIVMIPDKNRNKGQLLPETPIILPPIAIDYINLNLFLPFYYYKDDEIKVVVEIMNLKSGKKNITEIHDFKYNNENLIFTYKDLSKIINFDEYQEIIFLLKIINKSDNEIIYNYEFNMQTLPDKIETKFVPFKKIQMSKDKMFFENGYGKFSILSQIVIKNPFKKDLSLFLPTKLEGDFYQNNKQYFTNSVSNNDIEKNIFKQNVRSFREKFPVKSFYLFKIDNSLNYAASLNFFEENLKIDIEAGKEISIGLYVKGDIYFDALQAIYFKKSRDNVKKITKCIWPIIECPGKRFYFLSNKNSNGDDEFGSNRYYGQYSLQKITKWHNECINTSLKDSCYNLYVVEKETKMLRCLGKWKFRKCSKTKVFQEGFIYNEMIFELSDYIITAQMQFNFPQYEKYDISSSLRKIKRALLIPVSQQIFNK